MKTSLFCTAVAAGLVLTSMVPAAAEENIPEGHVLALPEPVKPASLPPAKSHPFAAMSGAWTGGGMMDMTNEIHERIRCRASYNTGHSVNNLLLSIRCASDNYKFELTSNVVENGGALSGTWKEEAYNVSGAISGRINGSRISAMARGDSFTAALTVNTTGNQQSVTITPQATYITGVQINLSRVAAAAATRPAQRKKP